MSDVITLVVEKSEFRFWSSFTITRSIETFDTFSFDAPFEQNSAINEIIRPLQFKAGQIYIDDDLFSTIVLVNPLPTLGAEESSISVDGYAKPGILNDCSVKYTDYPLEFTNQTLEQIASKLCSFFDIGVEFRGTPASVGSFPAPISGAAFEKVKLEAGESPLSFLIKLAKKRAFLTSNTNDGKLLFWKASKSPVVTTLKQGHTPLISVDPDINPQEFYSEITCLSPAAFLKEAESVTIKNPLVSISRPLVYIDDQELSGSDLQDAVKWKMGRMIANAIKYNISVQGLRNDRGEIWDRNTYINLTAPDAYCNNETTFLIDNLTLAKSDSDITTMQLVLPEARLGGIPERLPWG